MHVYDIIGETVAAPSHATGTHNQDAMHIQCIKAARPITTVAVSDGHGSPAHFRSDIGSCLAVRALAATVFEQYTMHDHGEGHLRDILETLPELVVARWRLMVADDLLVHPITLDDLKRLSGLVPRNEFRSVLLNPLIAYGATLVAAVATNSDIAYLKLGDGDILEVSEAYSVTTPFENDNYCGEETDSLCMPDAAARCRTRCVPLGSTPPRLVLVSTDGYSKSFASHDDYMKVASDMAMMMNDSSPAFIAQHLKSWLRKASGEGSRDDVTCALLFREPDCAAMVEVPAQVAGDDCRVTLFKQHNRK